jgi:hypothetical protein
MMKKTKRVEITATILIDVEIDESKEDWTTQALAQVEAWCDRNLDSNDSIQMDDSGARIYPDYTGPGCDASAVNILWDQEEVF